MVRQEVLRLSTRVDARPIPDQQESFRHLPEQVFERFNHLSTVHAPFEMAFVNLAREGQAHGGGYSAPFGFNASQNRTPAARGPGAAQNFLKRKTKLVEKHDVQALSSRFFLMRGQSCASHARIAASSRSRARGKGCCRLNPKRASRRFR